MNLAMIHCLPNSENQQRYARMGKSLRWQKLAGSAILTYDTAIDQGTGLPIDSGVAAELGARVANGQASDVEKAKYAQWLLLFGRDPIVMGKHVDGLRERGVNPKQFVDLIAGDSDDIGDETLVEAGIAIKEHDENVGVVPQGWENNFSSDDFGVYGPVVYDGPSAPWGHSRFGMFVHPDPFYWLGEATLASPTGSQALLENKELREYILGDKGGYGCRAEVMDSVIYHATTLQAMDGPEPGQADKDSGSYRAAQIASEIIDYIGADRPTNPGFEHSTAGIVATYMPWMAAGAKDPYLPDGKIANVGVFGECWSPFGVNVTQAEYSALLGYVGHDSTAWEKVGTGLTAYRIDVLNKTGFRIDSTEKVIDELARLTGFTHESLAQGAAQTGVEIEKAREDAKAVMFGTFDVARAGMAFSSKLSLPGAFVGAGRTVLGLVADPFMEALFPDTTDPDLKGLPESTKRDWVKQLQHEIVWSQYGSDQNMTSLKEGTPDYFREEMDRILAEAGWTPPTDSDPELKDVPVEVQEKINELIDQGYGMGDERGTERGRSYAMTGSAEESWDHGALAAQKAWDKVYGKGSHQ